MNLDETIRLQALKRKQLTSNGADFDLLDHVIGQSETLPPQMRNICAAVSSQLFDHINETCQMLDLSKRQFVELALIEALKKAEAIVEEIDPFMGQSAGDH